MAVIICNYCVKELIREVCYHLNLKNNNKNPWLAQTTISPHS